MITLSKLYNEMYMRYIAQICHTLGHTKFRRVYMWIKKYKSVNFKVFDYKHTIICKITCYFQRFRFATKDKQYLK